MCKGVKKMLYYPILLFVLLLGENLTIYWVGVFTCSHIPSGNEWDSNARPLFMCGVLLWMFLKSFMWDLIENIGMGSHVDVFKEFCLVSLVRSYREHWDEFSCGCF